MRKPYICAAWGSAPDPGIRRMRANGRWNARLRGPQPPVLRRSGRFPALPYPPQRHTKYAHNAVGHEASNPGGVAANAAATAPSANTAATAPSEKGRNAGSYPVPQTPTPMGPAETVSGRRSACLPVYAVRADHKKKWPACSIKEEPPANAPQKARDGLPTEVHRRAP